MNEPSRQMRWQRRMISEGRCRICGKDNATESNVFCTHHLTVNRNAGRRRLGIDLSLPLMGKGRGFKWADIDWSLRNVDIAKVLDCSASAVGYQRKKKVDSLQANPPN